MSYKESIRILNEEKKVIDDQNNTLDKYSFFLKQPLNMDILFKTISGDLLKLSIYQTPKNLIKISLNVMENSRKIPIFRIDYNGTTHNNPCEVNDNVPQIFHKYAGHRFNSTHVHFYVDGYNNLAWALPIDETEIRSIDIKYSTVLNDLKFVLDSLFDYINTKTNITINMTVI